MALVNQNRILSIQSHVVHGYVGQKSAVLPLQLLGFEVDPINSVQFTNHTHYKLFKGQILGSNELDELFDGLKSNGLTRYSHLLTGYSRSPEFLLSVYEIIKQLKSLNSNLIYVCDPVMGDEGKMYVPESILPIYKEKIVPLADVLLPNQYEIELLTDIKVNNEEDALRAIDALHSKGVKVIIISSSSFAIPGDNSLNIYGSYIKKCKQTDVISKEQYKCTIPKIDVQFFGTGDLFAALILGWLQKTDFNLKETLEKTISTMQAVLNRTTDIANNKDYEFTSWSDRWELKLVQSIDDIRNPKSMFKVETLTAEKMENGAH